MLNIDEFCVFDKKHSVAMSESIPYKFLKSEIPSFSNVNNSNVNTIEQEIFTIIERECLHHELWETKKKKNKQKKV